MAVTGADRRGIDESRSDEPSRREHGDAARVVAKRKTRLNAAKSAKFVAINYPD